MAAAECLMPVVCWRTVYLQLVCLFVCTLTFNLDVTVPIVKTGPKNSYFGFSIAQHYIYNENKHFGEPVLLVGAPRDNISDPNVEESVRQIVRPGVVYKCPVTSSLGDCVALKIDQEESGIGVEKEDQWMGVSVASQSTDQGSAIACAHRFKKSGLSYRFGLGICVSMTNALDEDEFRQPCEGKPTLKGHGEYGYCQAGISSTISQDGDLVLGAPGPYNWRGAIIKNTVHQSLNEDKRWYWSPVEDKNDTSIEPATDYYSYLGMSVKIGNVIGGKKTYVSGAPRSKDVGQVLMFRKNPHAGAGLTIAPKHYLTGEKFGSCFGYDLAIADFNSDGREDLAVGAPFYHDSNIHGVGGAVYIYMNSQEGITSNTRPMKILSRTMKDAECRELDCQNARFGFAVSSAGDLDRDGFNDLVVGAPFEGLGAVYIFRGSAHGIIDKYSQRIYASDLVSAQPLSTFGYAFSSGVDMDLNGYPDVVVGAYRSDMVVLLRSRPVIKIDASLESSPYKIMPHLTECSKDGMKNNCFELRLCFRFTAEPKERFTGPIDIDYRLEVERSTGAKISRVFFKGTNREQGQGHFIERALSLIDQSRTDCSRKHIGYIYRDNKDFLHPLNFNLTYKLKNVSPPTMTPGHPLPDINLFPVLNEATSQVLLAIDFVKNCRDDTECISNLAVKGELLGLLDNKTKDYVLRIGQHDDQNIVKLKVIVTNTEEEAHEAMLIVTVPNSLDFKGTDELGKEYSCGRVDNDNTTDYNTVVCYIGNPLTSDQEATFVIRFDASNVLPTSEKLGITLQMNTTSRESSEIDNKRTLWLRVIVETDLTVRGQSEPSHVYFGGEVVGESAIKREEQIGAEIIHRFEVKNVGSGRVASSKLLISWPYEVLSEFPEGKHLLYLLDQPQVDGNGSCNVNNSMINRLNVTRKVSSNLASRPSRQSRSLTYVNVRPKRSDDFSPSKGSVATLECDTGKTARCYQFECNIGELPAGQSVVVRIRSRIWNSTFIEDFSSYDRVLISSRAEIKIDPKHNIQQQVTLNDVGWANTTAWPDIRIQGAPDVPLWVIILAILAGIILLCIIILALWKCGFFKRHKSDEMVQHKAKIEKQKNYEDYD